MELTKKPNVREETTRYLSQRTRMLNLLKNAPTGTVTNVDLMRIAGNYTMRISELRKDGHVIQSEYERPGVWRYFYKGKRDE
ncbi:MAG: helix-turn-helix domain-containing protein [Patescibacteria group bacterium]|nr:helix-turn-helix domain-containing protein [Patescibacteria group bacterium]